MSYVVAWHISWIVYYGFVELCKFAHRLRPTHKQIVAICRLQCFSIGVYFLSSTFSRSQKFYLSEGEKTKFKVTGFSKGGRGMFLVVHFIFPMIKSLARERGSFTSLAVATLLYLCHTKALNFVKHVSRVCECKFLGCQLVDNNSLRFVN